MLSHKIKLKFDNTKHASRKADPKKKNLKMSGPH